MHPMLNTAIKAARRAATVINRASFDLDRITISEKNHNDFVTDIDQASEQAIVETLLKAYPDHAILGEESGASRNLNDESEYVWIIDPIDGTTNFMHGYPNYCVSIALQQRGVITQAVVYDPVRNDLYTATKGAGAYLNEKRIRVRNPDRINKTLIGSGHGADPRALAEYLRMYEVVAQRCQGVRSSGSAALELANVAAGRIDGYLREGPEDLGHRRRLAAGDGSGRHRRRIQRRIRVPEQGRHHRRRPESVRRHGRLLKPFA
jgi:myo-inositol-1(or 4)-monophosphatase